MVGGWCLLLAHLGYRYVLAPTHILTDLRESLDTPTSDKLRSVLARNLTKIPDHELEPQLSEWFAPPRIGSRCLSPDCDFRPNLLVAEALKVYL